MSLGFFNWLSDKAFTVWKFRLVLGYSPNLKAPKTFNEKIKAIKVSYYNFIIHYSDVISLANNLQKSEPFEVVDLVGNEYSKKKPLIAVEATLQDAYFKQ